MAEGKWIPEVTARTPLADAARWVLALRLEVVRDCLEHALREPGEDIEYVHQLRVGTRRAAAAVEIFSVCLPDKAYRKARKQLRRIRRAAGAARDWDVFLAALSDTQPGTPQNRPGLDFLVGYAFALREAAQTHLEEVCPDYPFDFERLLAETVAAVRPVRTDAGEQTLLDLAQSMLTGRLQDLDEAAARDLDDYENLHQVRIAGKRLRYAMEVFANCFAPEFREQLYPQVEEMQEILGQANDSFVACQRLRHLRDQLRENGLLDRRRYEPALRGLLRMHERRLPMQRRRFKAWWARWQKRGGEAAFWALLELPVIDARALALQRGTPAGGTDGVPGPGNGAGTDGITGADGTEGATPPVGGGGAGPTPP